MNKVSHHRNGFFSKPNYVRKLQNGKYVRKPQNGKYVRKPQNLSDCIWFTVNVRFP